MHSASTLVDIVVGDHESIRAMFEAFHGARNAERSPAFAELRRFLLAHEVAEEVVLYPAYSQVATASKEAPSRRIDEQSSIAEMLARLARLGVEDWRFDSLFAELEACVQSHARQEESQILPVLLEEMPDAELIRLGQRYCKARDGETAPRVANAPVLADRTPAEGPAEAARLAHDALAVTMERGAA